MKISLNMLLVIVIATQSFTLIGQDVLISEYMAINDATLTDEDGDYSDWIEIHNTSSNQVSLKGWSLTDNPENLTKWAFPDISVNANSYLIVFASEKKRNNAASELHTNFKLSGSGEYLALVNPSGNQYAAHEGAKYPAQEADVSYALFDGQYYYTAKPTPGTANQKDGRTIAPIFDHLRGFYDAPFVVSLHNANTNADIYYTLNGSSPTTANAKTYTDPISISKTTVLSAVAIDRTTKNRSELISQTYIFPDITQQSNSPAGYPDVWGQGYPADYEMDPEICTPANQAALQESLKSLPTISIVLDVDHLFLDSEDITKAGIYLNSIETADEWERPASIEYFEANSDIQFQVNCGLRVHGGNGRKPGNSPKHSFRVSFRSEYGPSKLNFNVFDEGGATNEFDALVLRAGYNYSWLKNDPAQCEGTDYIRDPFAKKTQLEMDRISAHSKFAHLYLNGIYWGVYNISEKITDDFLEEYLGGKVADYDVIKDHNDIADGDANAWNALMSAVSAGFDTNDKYMKVQGKNADGSPNAAFANLLDVRNFTDYMIINYYMGNKDWDKNNWIAGRNRVTNEDGFKFFCWDTETSMVNLNENILSVNNPGNPTGIFNRLIANEEYKLFFADRVQKHFFNGGVLTSEETAIRYSKIASTISQSMLAESARWGDYRRDVDGGSKYSLYTKDGKWQKQVDHMMQTYLPQRSEIALNQFKSANLIPTVDAPVLSQHGGDLATAIDLQMSAATNTIYYTTDDTDPRLIGGAVAPNAIKYENGVKIDRDMIIKARAKNGNTWSALTRAKFDMLIDLPVLEKSICENETYLGFGDEGIYVATLSAASGADSLVELHLSVDPLPQINIGNDTTLIIGQPLKLSADADFPTYIWSTDESTKSITVRETETGKYSFHLYVKDQNGCANSDTVQVTYIDGRYVLKSDNADLIFYPNPVKDQFFMEGLGNFNSSGSVKIFDMKGKLMKHHDFTTSANAVSIDMRDLPKGIYILELNAGEISTSWRLIRD